MNLLELNGDFSLNPPASFTLLPKCFDAKAIGPCSNEIEDMSDSLGR